MAAFIWIILWNLMCDLFRNPCCNFDSLEKEKCKILCFSTRMSVSATSELLVSKKWRQNDSIFFKYFLFSIIYFLFYTFFIFFVFFYFFSQWNVSLRFFTGTYMGWYMAAKKGLLDSKFSQSHNKYIYYDFGRISSPISLF